MVFQEDSTDTTAADAQRPGARRPDATGVPVGVRPQATFSESVTGSTVSMVLRGPANQVVAVRHVVRRRHPHRHPDADHRPAATPRPTPWRSAARKDAGEQHHGSGVVDASRPSAPPPPGVEDGPGGPIAVVTSTGNPSSSYLSEILRAEGLNEFANRPGLDAQRHHPGAVRRGRPR